MHFSLKTYTIVIGLILLLMACGNKTNHKMQAEIQADSVGLKNMKFKVVIVNYGYARMQKHVTSVDQDSLQSELYKEETRKEIQSRALTDIEKEKLYEFLSDFPLTKLKNTYESGVKDGTVLTFSIIINQVKKDIYVGNIYQKDLGALVNLIVSMLETNYICYNLTSVPETE